MSFEKIVDLFKSVNHSKLKDYLQSLSQLEIFTCLEDVVQNIQADKFPQLLSALFSGLSNENYDKILKIFLKSLWLFSFNDLPSKCSEEVLQILNSELSRLKVPGLVQVVDRILNLINNCEAKSFRGLELLPKLHLILGDQKFIIVQGESFSGEQYKAKIIHSLSSSKWIPKCLLTMASVVKELDLTSDELKKMMLTFFKHMDLIETEDLPVLIYQLLLISSKGCQVIILKGIVDHFNKNREASTVEINGNERGKNHTDSSEMDFLQTSLVSCPFSTSTSSSAFTSLSQAESTSIYHITIAMRQNIELSKEMIKFFKISQHVQSKLFFSSFSLLLLFALAKNNVFEKQIIDLLKQSLKMNFQANQKCSQSRWLNHLNNQDISHICISIQRAVTISLSNWENVMEGLVAFGFSLLETQPKATFGKNPTETTYKNSHFTNTLFSLAEFILISASNVHVNVALEVINQLIGHVISSKNSTIHYTDLLKKIIRSCASLFSVSNNNNINNTVKSIFDYLSLLPSKTSEQLLISILPLVRINPVLKNSLILVLRKAIFSKFMETKLLAVDGFLLLLNHLKVISGTLPSLQSQQLYSSQVLAEVHKNFDYYEKKSINKKNKKSLKAKDGKEDEDEEDNKQLCYEVFGILKRILTSQSEVKKCLYDGIVVVATGKNKNLLLLPVLDMLFKQLLSYYDNDETCLPPLNFSKGILEASGSFVLVEPLPELIDSIIELMKQRKNKNRKTNSSCNEDREEEEEGEELFVKVEEVLDSVADRMCKSDLEDFEFDNTLDFDVNGCQGNKNVYLFSLVTGVLVVLIQREFEKSFTFNNVEDEEKDKNCITKLNRMTKLFALLQSFHNFSLENQPNKKPKNKKSSSLENLPAKSYLSPRFLVTLCSFFIEIPDLECFDSTFVLFFFNILLFQIQNSNFEQNQDDYFYIAKIAIRKYINTLKKKNRSNQQNATDNDNNNNDNNNNNNNNNINNNKNSNSNNNSNNNNSTNAIKTKQLNSLCIKIFQQVVTMVTKDEIKEKWQSFLEYIDLKNLLNKKTQNNLSLLPATLIILQKLFLNVLTNGDDKTITQKDLHYVLQSIYSLIGCLATNENQEFLKELYEWSLKLFKDRKFEDSEVLRLLLRLLFHLLRKVQPHPFLLKNIARDLHTCLGDIDQEKNIEDQLEFSCVSSKSSLIILQQVLLFLEKEIEDSSFLMQKMKDQSQALAYFHQAYQKKNIELDEEKKNEEKENEILLPSPSSSIHPSSIKSLCTHLSCLTDFFTQLLQTRIPYGMVMELAIKCLNRFFSLLSTFVKLYIWNYGNRDLGLEFVVIGTFEKLVKQTACNLNKLVYPLITYVEATENDLLQSLNEKKKTKKKSIHVAKQEKTKTPKVTRALPNLVFNIEQYERFLISLAKKSKVDLMAHFKLSTSRDFRINPSILQAAIVEQMQEDDEEEEDEEEGESEEQKDREKLEKEESENENEESSSEDSTEESVSSSKRIKTK